MKRYSEMTNDELLALTSEQTDMLVELEFAHEGIIPRERPTEPDYHEIPKPTHKLWKVNGQLYNSPEDAQAVAGIHCACTDYESGCGYEYQYLESDGTEIENTITSVFVYSRDEYAKLTTDLKDNKSLKRMYDTALSDYKEWVKQTSKIRDRVCDAIRSASNHQYQLQCAQQQMERYIQLASGDITIAINFFNKAYDNVPVDIKNAVLDQYKQKSEE